MRFFRLLVIIFCVLIILALSCFFTIKWLYPKKYYDSVVQYSEEFGLPADLVLAVIKTESGFDANAVSVRGAEGLMQLMPSTAEWIAKELSVDDFDLSLPEINIRFGCFYLSYLFSKFSSTLEVLASYNAGETNVRSWWGEDNLLQFDEIKFSETKNYVNTVLRAQKIYRKLI